MAAAEQEHPDALYELDTLIAEEESLAEIQELPTGFDEVPEADLRPADGVEADMEWAAAEEPEARISRFEDVAEALESSVIDDEPSVEDQVAPEFQPAELHVRPTFGSDDDALFELSVGVSEGVLEDGFLDDIPEDPDAALAWLEQFIEESDTTVAESSRMESTAGSGIEETGLEVTPDLAETVRESPEETRLTGRLFEEMGDDLDQDVLDNIPEDPDEVVAWLQQFSREGEVAVAEPPTGAEEDELTRSGGPPLEATAETAELDESMPDLLIGEAPGLPGEDGLVDDIGVRFEEDLADSLPEWLMFEQGDEGGTKQTDWLRSLPAPDVAGWLEAEEEATVSGVYNFDTLTGSAATGYEEEPMVEIDLLEEIASEEATGEDEEEAMSAAADLDRSQLTMARRSLAGGDHDEAIAAYQSLIEKGEGLSTLIDDLESAASTFDSQPLLRRLLGDAYMQNGQLQKALDNYRQALDQL
jgi:hypothetical protein